MKKRTAKVVSSRKWRRFKIVDSKGKKLASGPYPEELADAIRSVLSRRKDRRITSIVFKRSSTPYLKHLYHNSLLRLLCSRDYGATESEK